MNTTSTTTTVAVTHQKLNHQPNPKPPNPKPPVLQQHTQQESPQQQFPPLLKRPTSGQDSYNEALTSKKQNAVILGDTIPKGRKTRILSTNLVRWKAISKCFPGNN